MTDSKKFIPAREVSRLTGLCYKTIRAYSSKNKFKTYKTPGRQTLYDLESVQEFVGVLPKSEEKENIIYCCLSPNKPEGELERQIAELRSKFPQYYLVTDIGSGNNSTNRGLKIILDKCLENRIGTLVVAHRDRLCGLGFELFEHIVTKSGGDIHVCQESPIDPSDEALADDIPTIIHAFNSRKFGRRKYVKKSAMEQGDPILADD